MLLFLNSVVLCVGSEILYLLYYIYVYVERYPPKELCVCFSSSFPPFSCFSSYYSLETTSEKSILFVCICFTVQYVLALILKQACILSFHISDTLFNVYMKKRHRHSCSIIFLLATKLQTSCSNAETSTS